MIKVNPDFQPRKRDVGFNYFKKLTATLFTTGVFFTIKEMITEIGDKFAITYYSLIEPKCDSSYSFMRIDKSKKSLITEEIPGDATQCGEDGLTESVSQPAIKAYAYTICEIKD